MRLLQEVPVKIVEWGREKIDMRDRRMAVMTPIEFHVKDDGTMLDLPTVAIVMTDGYIHVVGEISLSMLRPVIAALEAAERRQKEGAH